MGLSPFCGGELTKKQRLQNISVTVDRRLCRLGFGYTKVGFWVLVQMASSVKIQLSRSSVSTHFVLRNWRKCSFCQRIRKKYVVFCRDRQWSLDRDHDYYHPIQDALYFTKRQHAVPHDSSSSSLTHNRKHGAEDDLILPCSFRYVQEFLRYRGSKYLENIPPHPWFCGNIAKTVLSRGDYIPSKERNKRKKKKNNAIWLKSSPFRKP